MTLRLMPTTSVYDRDVAQAMYEKRRGNNLAHHSVFLMRGVDRSGKNDFRIRASAT